MLGRAIGQAPADNAVAKFVSNAIEGNVQKIATPKKKRKIAPLELVKKELTDEKQNRVYMCMHRISMLTEIIKIEYLTEMDVDLKEPYLNNLANRIGKDALEILNAMARSQKVQYEVLNKDYFEEYALEMHRVFHYFVGLEMEKVRDMMDAWDKAKEMGGEDIKAFVTVGFTDEELKKLDTLLKRKGVPESLVRKLGGISKECKED